MTYVRTAEGHEVDFLARSPDGTSDLIQVCADAADAATADRELRSLVEAGASYPDSAKRLLTLTRDGLPADVPTGVVAQPAYEWLLDTPE